MTPTPEGSGLLAQCNLQVTIPDSRGPASAHGVPQTVAIKLGAPPPLGVATRIRLEMVLTNCAVSRRCGRLGSNERLQLVESTHPLEVNVTFAVIGDPLGSKVKTDSTGRCNSFDGIVQPGFRSPAFSSIDGTE